MRFKNLNIQEALQSLDEGYAIRHKSHLPDTYLRVDLNTKDNFLLNEKGKLAGINLHGYSYYNIIREGWEIVLDVERYKYIKYNEKYKEFSVKSVSSYEESSVLQFQDKIVFIDSFKTIEEAKEKFPDAIICENDYEPQNTFDHLSDKSDLE